MKERQKNSIGIGLIVGCIGFLINITGWFGVAPSLDLVGSIGVGFGSGFSASVVSYMMNLK
jgi:hypothetical protein